jgi:hypothetical protein
LIATPIREDGTIVAERSAAALQSTGLSPLVLRRMLERAAKKMITKLAAAACSMFHPDT